MRSLTKLSRCARKSGVSILLLVGTLALAASTPNPETIQATSTQAGNTATLTLVVYNYSTATDLQLLSQAFQEGQDRGLATALSKTKAVGHCSIAGGLSYDVAFIQVVPTPTGRKLTFIATRPHPVEEADPPAASGYFDLALGQFDLNDADAAKSTGFLYPASKLLIDQQGEFHYDLAGAPWPLVNVLDSNSPTSKPLELSASD
ncbi:MAG: hypothetical protein ABSB60_04500 [Terracidiphilus sp.]